MQRMYKLFAPGQIYQRHLCLGATRLDQMGIGDGHNRNYEDQNKRTSREKFQQRQTACSV